MQSKQKNKIVEYWQKGATESLAIAESVFLKKYYNHALFCGHLALEKLLKAIIVDITNAHAPHSHDLLYLSGLAKIDLDMEQQKMLGEINVFNIEGRYPEEKLELFHKVNKEVAASWLKKIKILYLWLSKQSARN